MSFTKADAGVWQKEKIATRIWRLPQANRGQRNASSLCNPMFENTSDAAQNADPLKDLCFAGSAAAISN
jgi:hypothetical protein